MRDAVAWIRCHVDLINGCLELGSGIFQLANIRRLYLDKKVLGVSLWPTVFFTGWGVFNVTMFYTTMKLPLSLIGGWMIMITNCVWIIMALYYKVRK